jgi:hypothetical protein
MKPDNKDRRSISRRTVLAGTRLTLGAAIVATTGSPSGAQPSFNQADVMYQTMPKGDQRCGLCASFAPPNACQLVKGTISPNSWCQLFSPKG